MASVALVLCALGFAPAAQADVVVEVYHGVVSASARSEVVLFQRALADKGVEWNKQQPSALPQPGTRDQGVTFEDLLGGIELGKRESVRVLADGQINFAAGAKALHTALANARANAGVFVVQPNARATLARASSALAVALIRLGKQAEADAVLADLARTNGGAPLVGQGAEIEKHYNRINTAMARDPRGKLLLSVNDANALLFVNEVGVGRGGSFSADVIPGPYRIVVISNGTALRYDVEVASGAETKLDLDWSIETQLHVERDRIWVELNEGGEPSDERLQDIARRFWQRARLPGASAPGVRAIVFAVGTSCDRRIATALPYPADRSTIARVVLGKGDERERLVALAATVLDSKRRDDVYSTGERSWCTGEAPKDGAEPDEPPTPTTGGSSTKALVALAVGAAAVAGGQAWNALAGARFDGTAGSFGDPNVQAVVVASAGSIAVGASVAALVRHHYQAGWGTAGVLGLGVAATITGATLIGADEDSGASRPTELNDTGTAGVIVGAAGLTAIATAITLHAVSGREGPRPRRWLRWPGWVAVGAAVLGGGLTFNYAREDRHAGDDIQVVCAIMCAGEEYKALADRQSQAGRNTVIAGVASGALLVVGVTSLVLSRSPSEVEPPPVAFSVSHDGAFVQLGGAF